MKPIALIGIILHIVRMLMDTFKNEVEAFLAETGMAPTTFGREAVKDPGFVTRLRKGSRCWPETQEKCSSFMDARRRPPEDAA